MAELLYRLGKWSARRPWTVVFTWLAVLATAGLGFVFGFAGLVSSFDIPGMPSSKVVERLEKVLPEYAGASGTIALRTEDGAPLSDAQLESISALADGLRGLPDVAQVLDPSDAEQQRADRITQLENAQAQLEAARAQLDAQAAQAALVEGGQRQLDEKRAELESQRETLAQAHELLALSDPIHVLSEDRSTALVNLSFSKPRLELSEQSKQAVIDAVETHQIEGLEVGISTEIAQGVPQIIGLGEVLGLAVAAIVLGVMLRTLTGAAIPLVTALMGVAVGVLGSLSFSGLVQMALVTPVLGVMLGLAVGIDYSLFIINRHRKQLADGAELHESIGLANGTSGNAVVFAGATVVVALLALTVTGIPFLGVMGAVGAIAVAAAVLIAVTLTPALLGLAGSRIQSRRERIRPRSGDTTGSASHPMSWWRAGITVAATTAALLIVAAPALSMRVGLPDGSAEPPGSYPQRAHLITEEEFGPGTNGPLLVTAELPANLDDAGLVDAQLRVARAIVGLGDVVAVAPIAVSDDLSMAAFQIVPKDGPNSESTETLVRALRELGSVDADLVIGVAGQAAINIDISERLLHVLPLYLVVVIGLSLVIMIVVFRSLLVPLIATGGFVLSLFATYGALTAVFQWGWGSSLLGLHSTGPILNFLPIILVGILFGLAMDYQLFLATGMREAYVHGADARMAVTAGFRAGRGVVTAAGLIMVSVFGGFVFSESTIIRSLGFGLAAGIVFDAFVVRMLLMPALMHLAGSSAWWLPRWLDRIVPNVDVEGAALERRHRVH